MKNNRPNSVGIGFSLLNLNYSPFSTGGSMDPTKKPGNARLVDPNQLIIDQLFSMTIFGNFEA